MVVTIGQGGLARPIIRCLLSAAGVIFKFVWLTER